MSIRRRYTSRSYLYDETNRMVEGTNWKGDKSTYTYNGLGLRVGNTQTTHAGKAYTRDYVIDYTSFENDDLMVFAEGNGQLEYEQKHVYAGSERILQFTDKGNWERTLYVHEDVMGSTRYYTKSSGQSFAELTYDAWGMPQSPNKLLNNDHGNYVFATFTGHIYDTTLDIYFAEARFYDANNRTWLAMDPIKDGGNWYQYCSSNPVTFYDPTGLAGFSPFSGCVDMNKLAEQVHSGVRNLKGKVSAFVDNIDWSRVGTGVWKNVNATIVAFYGIMAVTSTSGSIVFAVQGLLGGTVAPGTAVVTGGTFVSGVVALLCAAADSLEASQDLIYGLQGSDREAVNVIRDNLFAGNEATYYDIEMLSTGGAAIGTYVFQAYGLESEINAAEIARYEKGSSKTISYADYDKIYRSSIHNAGKDKLMLGKYDGGGSTSYIAKAGDDYTYFDLGNKWDITKTEYGFTDDDMFKLFNESFLDDAINEGKTIQFSHNPINDTGALGQEFEYLLKNNYKWEEGTMTMKPRY